MVSWVDILCEKLSGAECKIRSLITENEELQEGMIQQLLDYNEQTIIFKTREQELENEKSDLDEKLVALKKKLKYNMIVLLNNPNILV